MLFFLLFSSFSLAGQPSCKDLFSDPKLGPLYRFGAVLQLGDKDPSDPKVRKGLEKSARDENPHVRGTALLHLARQHPLDEEIQKQIAIGLFDKEPTVQETSAEILRDLKPSSQKILDKMIKRLFAKENLPPLALEDLILALGEAKMHSPKLNSKFKEFLSHKDPHVRGAAKKALKTNGA